MEKGFRLQDKREGYKSMLDLTKGYDPTKPLIYEFPLDCFEDDVLAFPRTDNITDSRIFYSGDPLEKQDYQLIFRINKREEKLLESDIVPAYYNLLIVNNRVLNILNKGFYEE